MKVQKRFIDYAADMGWHYTLVDSAWDRQIGYDGIRRAGRVRARAKNVKILIWYNSAGDWNTTPLTPRDRMLSRERRRAEMRKIKSIGIAGLKVDFFGGDAQSMISLLPRHPRGRGDVRAPVNFHGATLPRGWQRTYPNLMTMEAVRGLEFITFEQRNADDEPTHAAMLPFTRNVFDPMDFTPVVLDAIPNIERRTTGAFELALTVLFTSGIQHYAEIPAGMAKAPAYVRDFLRDVPAVWDEVKFIDGYPGQYVVLARRAAGRWYVAGINGDREPRNVELDLAAYGAEGGTLITDGGEALGLEHRALDGNNATMALRPGGGFVAILPATLR